MLKPLCISFWLHRLCRRPASKTSSVTLFSASISMFSDFRPILNRTIIQQKSDPSQTHPTSAKIRALSAQSSICRSCWMTFGTSFAIISPSILKVRRPGLPKRYLFASISDQKSLCVFEIPFLAFPLSFNIDLLTW